ncbi:leucine-rich repeat domain-containing protein [Anaerosporobacter sp.]
MKIVLRNRHMICVAVLLIILSISGCEKAKRQDDTNSVTMENEIILFTDPVIELETRRILNKSTGDITQNDVLSITDFGIDGTYDSFDEISSLATITDKITSLTDLKYFKNLKVLVLPDNYIKSLDGIEVLTNLQALCVRNNKITSIEPVRKLVNLVYFDCAENDIDNYSALSELINMEELCIGSNDAAYTDLSPLKKLTKLKSLYASRCGISDISVLNNMINMEDLLLSNNNISDISVLRHMENLNFLGLDSNSITNIESLSGLTRLEYVYLEENPISKKTFNDYYTPSEEDYFTTTFHSKLQDDMPEFTFDLSSYLDKKTYKYAVQTITITNTNDGTILQTIDIPELSLFGQTNISVSDRDTMGFELEDVNFDGYKDIRLYDILNGTYRVEWIYLVWNPDKALFVSDKRLNEIPLATFDQEKQLIYGTERGSAGDHDDSTYKYINGEPTLISYTSEKYVNLDHAQVKKYLTKASVKTDLTEFMTFHVTVSERNDKTGKMKIISDKYIIYPYSDGLTEDKILLEIDASSEIGQAISNSN